MTVPSPEKNAVQHIVPESHGAADDKGGKDDILQNQYAEHEISDNQVPKETVDWPAKIVNLQSIAQTVQSPHYGVRCVDDARGDIEKSRCAISSTNQTKPVEGLI